MARLGNDAGGGHVQIADPAHPAWSLVLSVRTDGGTALIELMDWWEWEELRTS
jgi:hypothetical protein